MKKTIETALGHLSQAIMTMPQDFSLRQARVYLNNALTEIRKVQNKKSKREAINKTHEEINRKKEEMYNSGVNDQHALWQMTNPETMNQAIKNLDKMIGEEKAKLIKKKQESEKLEDLLG